MQSIIFYFNKMSSLSTRIDISKQIMRQKAQIDSSGVRSMDWTDFTTEYKRIDPSFTRAKETALKDYLQRPAASGFRYFRHGKIIFYKEVDSPMTTNAQNFASTSSAANSSFLASVECPICLEIALPPYVQCQNGHLVCGNCRPKLQQCPTCRAPKPAIRNLALDHVASSSQFPCSFFSNGCLSAILLSERARHEQTCIFQPFKCPSPAMGGPCQWQGSLDKVIAHISDMHKWILNLQGPTTIFNAEGISPGAGVWAAIVKCFGVHFMLELVELEKSDDQFVFHAVVQLLGTPKQADSFMYRLELCLDNRRLIWVSKVKNARDGTASAMAHSDCFCFALQTAELFTENGALTIDVQITKM